MALTSSKTENLCKKTLKHLKNQRFVCFFSCFSGVREFRLAALGDHLTLALFWGVQFRHMHGFPKWLEEATNSNYSGNCCRSSLAALATVGLQVSLLVHICDVEALPAKESQQIQQAAKEKHSPASCQNI